MEEQNAYAPVPLKEPKTCESCNGNGIQPEKPQNPWEGLFAVIGLCILIALAGYGIVKILTEIGLIEQKDVMVREWIVKWR